MEPLLPEEVLVELRRAGFCSPAFGSVRCLVDRKLADAMDKDVVEAWCDRRGVPRFWYSIHAMESYSWLERFLLATGQMRPKGPTLCPYSPWPTPWRERLQDLVRRTVQRIRGLAAHA